MPMHRINFGLWDKLPANEAFLMCDVYCGARISLEASQVFLSLASRHVWNPHGPHLAYLISQTPLIGIGVCYASHMIYRIAARKAWLAWRYFVICGIQLSQSRLLALSVSLFRALSESLNNELQQVTLETISAIYIYTLWILMSIGMKNQWCSSSLIPPTRARPPFMVALKVENIPGQMPTYRTFTTTLLHVQLSFFLILLWPRLRNLWVRVKRYSFISICRLNSKVPVKFDFTEFCSLKQVWQWLCTGDLAFNSGPENFLKHWNCCQVGTWS